MCNTHLHIKSTVGGVQVLRPADECHPGLIIISVLERLTGIFRISNLQETVVSAHVLLVLQAVTGMIENRQPPM